MITLTEVSKGITRKVKAAIKGTEFEGIAVVAKDVQKIERPSIKIDLGSVEGGRYNANCKDNNIMPSIYFFASDLEKYRIENMKMLDILQNAFLTDLLVGEAFYIPINDFEGTTTDTVLVCNFTLETLEVIPDLILDGQEYEPMEELEIKINNEEV